jgi:transposase
MRYVGIDIGAEHHVVAVVDEDEAVLVRPTRISEDRVGYERLREALGGPKDTLVAMEATGHYWQNLFAFLAGEGYQVALLNPLRTHRFAQEDLARTKTDAIDALAIARFARQKRPAPLAVPEELTLELRELVRLRDQIVEDMGARLNQLHRLVDLGFPEFTQVVKTLDGPLATALLAKFPTARSFASAKPAHIAKLPYGTKSKVGEELARALILAAKTSVGAHHGEPYKLQVAYACEDLDLLRKRLRAVSSDIDGLISKHEIGNLLVTIPGIGPQTAARILAEAGDLDRFDSPAQLASYAGLVPGLRHSGKSTPASAPLSSIGNARLRRGLYMPTLTAVRKNPWLRAFYERLVARGKPKKLALTAAARKLLHAAFSVAKNKRPFVPLLPAATGPMAAAA